MTPKEMKANKQKVEYVLQRNFVEDTGRTFVKGWGALDVALATLDSSKFVITKCKTGARSIPAERPHFNRFVTGRV